MKKITFATLAIAFLTLTSANQVLAHATPITYEPEASSVFESVPQQITIRFSERVEPHASGISVLGPDGESVHIGNAAADANDAHIYSIKLKEGAEGTHTVSWHVVSADDGHFTKGAYVFFVGKESAAITPTESQFQIVHSSALPETMTIWAELAGQAVLLGFLVFYAFFWRHLREKYAINDSLVERRLSVTVLVAILLILVGTSSYLVLKTTEIQQLQNLEFAEAFRVLLTTLTGSFTLYRFIAAFLFGVVFFVLRKCIFASFSFTKSEVALWILLLATAYMRARVSHAAASHFLPDFSVFVNFTHLVGKSLWVGGLIVFAFVFMPIMQKIDAKFARSSSILFSKITSIAFGATAVSGVYIIWLHLKDPVNSFTTEWGLRFVILTFIALIFLGVRLYHQFIADRKKELAAWLPLTVSTEAIVGIALLFVTSFLIITTPPLTYGNSFVKIEEGRGVTVSLQEHPFESSNLLVAFKNQDGRTIPIEYAVITLTNQERGIGPIVAQTEQRSEGSFVLPKNMFSPAGVWQINITGQRQESYNAVVSFQVDFPREVNAGRADPYARIFGYFEILSIIGAVGAVGLTYFLYRWSGNLYSSAREESIIVGVRHHYYYSFLASTVILFVVWLSYAYVFKSDFQKICEVNGHFWNQTVPQRFGKATEQIAITGCSLGVGAGQFHFADVEEYVYFLRPAEANVELVTSPTQLRAGEPIALTFLVKDGEGKPVRDLAVEHERLLHTIMVSEDFESFTHMHAEDQGLTKADIAAARFSLRHTFSKAGRYLISVDFVVRARHFSEQFTLNVGGEPKMGTPSKDLSREKVFDGYKVTLFAPASVKAKELVKLQYFIEKDGAPVSDLEPYLGALMHLAVVRSDFGRFIHTHGETPPTFFQRLTQRSGQHIHGALPNAFGPAIDGYLSFPNPGVYQIFGEFKHDGKAVVTRFKIEVD